MKRSTIAKGAGAGLVLASVGGGVARGYCHARDVPLPLDLDALLLLGGPAAGGAVLGLGGAGVGGLMGISYGSAEAGAAKDNPSLAQRVVHGGKVGLYSFSYGLFGASAGFGAGFGTGAGVLGFFEGLGYAGGRLAGHLL